MEEIGTDFKMQMTVLPGFFYSI